MKKFDYKMLIGNPIENAFQQDEKELQALGNEGWELVSVIYPVKPRDQGLGAKSILYFLKKEID